MRRLSGYWGSRENPDQGIDQCGDSYGIDKNHRYQFEMQVRPDDTYRNHQIDVLATTPEDKKRLSVKYTNICVLQDRPGVNFGFSQGQMVAAVPEPLTFAFCRC